MPVSRGGESFKRALQDALASDINPGAGGHLSVHDQAQLFQAVKLVVVGPVPYKIRVGKQDARGICVGAEHAHRLARLHQQRLVVFQFAQASHDGVERWPVARGAPGAAVDDELFGLFGDVGVEVVHEHPQSGFLLPAFARDFKAPRRADDGCRSAHLLSVSYALADFPETIAPYSPLIRREGPIHFNRHQHASTRH